MTSPFWEAARRVTRERSGRPNWARRWRWWRKASWAASASTGAASPPRRCGPPPKWPGSMRRAREYGFQPVEANPDIKAIIARKERVVQGLRRSIAGLFQARRIASGGRPRPISCPHPHRSGKGRAVKPGGSRQSGDRHRLPPGPPAHVSPKPPGLPGRRDAQPRLPAPASTGSGRRRGGGGNGRHFPGTGFPGDPGGGDGPPATL